MFWGAWFSGALQPVGLDSGRPILVYTTMFCASHFTLHLMVRKLKWKPKCKPSSRNPGIKLLPIPGFRIGENGRDPDIRNRGIAITRHEQSKKNYDNDISKPVSIFKFFPHTLPQSIPHEKHYNLTHNKQYESYHIQLLYKYSNQYVQIANSYRPTEVSVGVVS